MAVINNLQLGFNCSQLVSNHIVKTSTLSLLAFQRKCASHSNSSNIHSNHFYFFEYLSTQGLFGTDQNGVHCTLCHRTVAVVEVSFDGKITYTPNDFHKMSCHYFKDPSHKSSRYPEYQTFESRIATFTNWPRNDKKPSPLSLATSGLLSLNNLDKVQCFSCAGILHTWLRDDKPDEEHAKKFPKC